MTVIPHEVVICLNCWCVVGIDGENNLERPTTICSHLRTAPATIAHRDRLVAALEGTEPS